MKRFRILLFLVISFFWVGTTSFAQQENRGSSVLVNAEPAFTGKTYAVIIGISTYQNIHKLQYADRDAKEFYKFLTSKSGGSVDSTNIKLLINQQAKRENLIRAVSKWLMEEKKPKKGDIVYIYFAGHGDAIPGIDSWLLGWDVPNSGDPATDYDQAGGIEVSRLKRRVRLMADSGVRVILITDACRGNELSGKKNGQDLVAKDMEENVGALQFSSCTKGEVSREDKSWGGGRGLYSYWLINGLYGMADKDSDGHVTIGELNEYVNAHVRAATSKKDANGKNFYEQNPFYCCSGNENDDIAIVDKEGKKKMAEIINGEEGKGLLAYNNNAERGINNVLSSLSDSVKSLFDRFENQIQDDTSYNYEWKNYMLTYNMLQRKSVPEEFRLNVKDELVIALFNHSQQVMNFFLDNKKYISNSSWGKYFTNAVCCLDSAMKLADRKDDELYRKIKWNRLILEAEAYFCSGGDYNEKIKIDLMKEGLNDLDSARVLNPKPSPILSHAYANIYFGLDNQNESMKYEYEAHKLAPGWPWPMGNIGFGYVFQNKFDSAEKYFQMTLQIDSTFTSALYGLGCIYSRQKQYEKAEMYFLNTIRLDSTFILAWDGLGGIYFSQSKYDKAEKYLQKALKINSENSDALIYLGIVYTYREQYDTAEQFYRRALKTDSSLYFVRERLGYLFLNQNKYDSAEYCFLKALHSDSTLFSSMEGLGYVYSDKKQYINAEKYYRKALLTDSTNNNIWESLGYAYYFSANYNLAEISFLKALQIDTSSHLFYYNLACCYSMQKDKENTFLYLNKALQSSQWIAYAQIMDDANLNEFKNTPEFKALLKKYFPGQYKE